MKKSYKRFLCVVACVVALVSHATCVQSANDVWTLSAHISNEDTHGEIKSRGDVGLYTATPRMDNMSALGLQVQSKHLQDCENTIRWLVQRVEMRLGLRFSDRSIKELSRELQSLGLRNFIMQGNKQLRKGKTQSKISIYQEAELLLSDASTTHKMRDPDMYEVAWNVDDVEKMAQARKEFFQNYAKLYEKVEPYWNDELSQYRGKVQFFNDNTDIPKISVVIPSLAERSSMLLKRIQEMNAASSEVQFEVVVVLADPENLQGKRELIEEASEHARVPVTLVESKKNTICINRNLGTLVSRGEYIIFLDDDVRLVGPVLSTLVDVLTKHHEVGIAQIVSYDAETDRIHKPRIGYLKYAIDQQTVVTNSTVGMVMATRKAIARALPFIPFWPNFAEDVWFGTQVKGFGFSPAFVYAPDAYVVHEHVEYRTSNRSDALANTLLYSTLNYFMQPEFYDEQGYFRIAKRINKTSSVESAPHVIASFLKDLHEIVCAFLENSVELDLSVFSQNEWGRSHQKELTYVKEFYAAQKKEVVAFKKVHYQGNNLAGVHPLSSPLKYREKNKKRVTKEDVESLERAFVMIKTDAVHYRDAGEVMLSLMERLRTHESTFRIVGAKIVRPQEAQLNQCYSTDGKYYGGPDDKTGILGMLRGEGPFFKCPIVSFVVEGEKGIVERIRRKSFLGPTDPSKELLTADEERRQSLRYEFLTKKGRPVKIPGVATRIVLNVMHCSELGEEKKQIPVFYEDRELKEYWNEEAVEKISEDWDEEKKKKNILHGASVDEWSFSRLAERGEAPQGLAKEIERQLAKHGLQTESGVILDLVNDALQVQREIERQENVFFQALEDKKKRDVQRSDSFFFSFEARSEKVGGLRQTAMSVLPQENREKLLNDAAVKLVQKGENIVFEKNVRENRWMFRHGNNDVHINQKISDQIGKRLSALGKRSFLFSPRNVPSVTMEKVLRNCMEEKADIADSFTEENIPCYFKYKKILLIAPYGDEEGQPLFYVKPHMGIELLAYRLRTEVEAVDACVYNPNLTSVEELFSHIKKNSYDAFGFSILPTVLRKNIEIIGAIRQEFPEALFFYGGMDVKNMPVQEVTAAFPEGIFVLDDGDSFVRVAREYDFESKIVFEKSLENIPNIIVSSGKEYLKTKEHKGFPNEITRHYADIPFEYPDSIHGKKYQKAEILNKTGGLLPLDRVGMMPFPLYWGNMCQSRCVFCALTLCTKAPPELDDAVDILATHMAGQDSIEIETPSFFDGGEKDYQLLHYFAESPYREMPKKVSLRASKITEQSIALLKKAGVSIGSIGIESFSTKILKELRKKRATREQNIRAIELMLESGITPGINLIMFTPWDSVETVWDTIETSIPYLERGAYLNLVPYMNAGYSNRVRDALDDEDILFEEYNSSGMRAALQYPRRAKIHDSQLRKIAVRTEEIKKALTRNYPDYASHTITINSLLYFKAFLLAYNEDEKGGEGVTALLSRIDAVIENTIGNMTRNDDSGVEKVFSYADYRQAYIPMDEDDSSLQMEAYMNSKFPEETILAIQEKRARIEIHRGLQSSTERFIELCKAHGYRVRMLETDEERMRLGYYIEREDGTDPRYIIANNIGYTRELFVAQMLRYYSFPEEHISIREFTYDIRNELLRHLQPYQGTISKVVFAHNIDYVIDVLRESVDTTMRVEKEFRGDIFWAYIVKNIRGERFLLYDITYTNGEFIKPVMEFFVDDVLQRGFGANDITMFAACGAIGDELNVNDLIVYDTVFKYDHVLQAGNVSNVLNKQLLQEMLPYDHTIHEASVFTVPTVLSSSRAVIERIEQITEKGIVELELAHALEALSHASVSFRAMYEVHDKPAARIGAKGKALGSEVPGLMQKEKRRANVVGVFSYLLKEWELKERMGKMFEGHAVDVPRVPITSSLECVVSEAEHAMKRVFHKGRKSMIAVGGLSGSGKSIILTDVLEEMCSREYQVKPYIVVGDRFVQPKEERTGTTFPDTLFNLEAIKSALADLKEGYNIALPIYNLAERKNLFLTEKEYRGMEKNLLGRSISVGREGARYYSLVDQKKFRHLVRNNHSILAIEPESHAVVEIIPGNGDVYIFDLTIALFFENKEVVPFDFKVFSWASLDRRLFNYYIGHKNGTRMLSYTTDKMKRKLKKNTLYEDPFVVHTADKADVIFINELPNRAYGNEIRIEIHEELYAA